MKLIMLGDHPFYEQTVLLGVLRGLQSDPHLAAEVWGIDGQASHEYDESRISLLAQGKVSGYVLQLERKTEIPQVTYIRLNKRPVWSTEIQTPRPEQWLPLFNLAEILVQNYHPKVAWVHAFSTLSPPVAEELDRIQILMDASVMGDRPQYDREKGPRGLGVRTYLGPELIERFGRDHLLRTPLQIAELAWGGIRLDLVEHPWESEQADLLSTWQAAMDHLRPTGVFPVAQQDERGHVFFKAVS